MSIDLQSLIELEKLDKEIAKLENSKMEFPKKVTDMEAELLEIKGALNAAQSRLDAHLKEIHKCELSLQENQHGLDTSHDRLNLVKTNREYDAILLEITERKEMIDRDRKKLQKLIEKKDSLTTETTNAEKAVSDAEAELQPKIDELKNKIGSIDDDITVVSAKKSEVLPLVPEKFLTEYSRILLKRKNAKVLSRISDKSTACGHCFQMLNAQVLKNARTSDSPVLCENCGSIVVFEKSE